jgi:hypothetical protein
MKAGYPVETAEYAVANKLVSEPAWVPTTLKVRERILSKVANTRYLCKEEKYGIVMPKSVNEALSIDCQTGSTYWAEAIKKDM